jgi:hypothetical protein
VNVVMPFSLIRFHYEHALMRIFLFYSDGKLEVVVPSFVHYLEVLEGSDGDKLPGWVRYGLPF